MGVKRRKLVLTIGHIILYNNAEIAAVALEVVAFDVKLKNLVII
jgi:hypothetical protein